MLNDVAYVIATQTWIKSVIIELGFCPFARRAYERHNVRFAVDRDCEMENCLHSLIRECERLDTDLGIETTLLIYADAFSCFTDYLAYLELAETLLADQGYEGIYQLASFHPDYLFHGVPQNDPANYTNRSPFPMLHLLRESSIEHAVAGHPCSDMIPQANIALARELGLAKMQALLASCYATG